MSMKENNMKSIITKSSFLCLRSQKPTYFKEKNTKHHKNANCSW